MEEYYDKKNKKELLNSYFKIWITVNKEGVRKVTMDKYKLSLLWIIKLFPKLRLSDINRVAYQHY